MERVRNHSFYTSINIISSIGVMIINLCISFFLSPYIIKNIGVEANGFITLANEFIYYANIIVTALNAMAARFITISYIQKDYQKANLYYNSVFWGNLIIVTALLIPAAYFIIKLENYINIPCAILTDVKILFLIVFFMFFLRTGAPNWDCGTYIANRMDLSCIPSMVTALLRCIILFCMFSLFTPRVWFVGFSSLVVSTISLIIAGYYTHKLTPELKINIRNPVCSWKAIKELVGSGIWNSISISGNMLLNGLDLLVCNFFLGSTKMGILSLSKILPNILILLSDSIRGAFGPELTISFAEGDKDKIFGCIKRAMKITSVVVTIPTAGIVVMSDKFYSLWVPSQDATLLQVLSTLAILSYLFNSGVVILFNVFSTVNKVRYNSVAMIVSGIVSLVTTLLLIYFTDLDLFAVAGVSSIVTICKNLFFTIPVTSKLLGFKWYQFYPYVGTSVICSVLIVIVGVLVRMCIKIETWSMFFVASFIIGTIGLILNFFVVLNKQERQFLGEMILKRLK